MVYEVVAQTEHEVPSDDDSRVPSPQPHAAAPTSFEPLSLDTDNLGTGSYLQRAEVNEDTGIRRLGSMVRSMRVASYESIEEDDYSDEEAVNPTSITSPRHPPAPAEDDNAELRTPTTESSVPLSHPTPGLQSLQGAYVHNVERLESLAQLSEQQALDEMPETSTTQPLADTFLPPPPTRAPLTVVNPSQHPQYHPMNEFEMERPSSAASGDTYRQARILFNDFDGVHYVPMDKGLDFTRKLSLNRPPLASRSEPHKQPAEGEDMVLYPAPVPMTINLPPKLSQRPDKTEREKRRTQLLDAVSPDNRKSAPWLTEQDQATGNDRRRTKQLSDLPSHLRASVFFEAPSTSIDIDLGQTSAVATLDSILDASTAAPVTAFTDHPFAGPMGPEVYGSSKHGNLPKEKAPPAKRNKLRRKSALDLSLQAPSPVLRSSSPATHLHPTTEAQAAETHETTSLRRRESDSESESGDDSEEESESSEDVEENDEELHFTGAPATLIAELEQRKHDLKQRNRTAGNAVGMHSTLLQLDAVAAKQSEHRRQKRVALAWEHPDAHPNVEDEDEDVPLGMLYPDKAQVTEEIRPLGLMERREMEEGEPLSRRRARLRGEPMPQAIDQRPMTMYSQAAPGPLVQEPEQDSGEEGETLGQRLRRLKGHERTVSKAGTDFTTELLAEFDHLKDDETEVNQDEPPQEDETLGQRRARLRKEATEKRNSGLKIPRYRRSMADILHTPRPSTGGQQSLQQEGLDPRGPTHQRSFDNRMSMQQFPAQYGPPKTAAGFSQYQAPSLAGPYDYPMAHPNTFYSDAILGNGNLSYAMPPAFHPNAMPQAIDPGQRAVIDRWRQSIV